MWSAKILVQVQLPSATGSANPATRRSLPVPVSRTWMRRRRNTPSFRLTEDGALAPTVRVRQAPPNAPMSAAYTAELPPGCSVCVGPEDQALIELLGEGARPPIELPRAAANKLFPLAFIRALQKHAVRRDHHRKRWGAGSTTDTTSANGRRTTTSTSSMSSTRSTPSSPTPYAHGPYEIEQQELRLQLPQPKSKPFCQVQSKLHPATSFFM